MVRTRPFSGIRVAITRPAGTGAAWARRVRELGGTPLLLPGASLRPASGTLVACRTLRAALACDVAIFTSPAAVRFAQRLGLPGTRAHILAPGAGTLRALARAGFAHAEAPAREDSEGILELPVLQHIGGRRIGIIGAAGGRGLLDR
jgi:uroporphyrinogen-III synthase